MDTIYNSMDVLLRPWIEQRLNVEYQHLAGNSSMIEFLLHNWNHGWFNREARACYNLSQNAIRSKYFIHIMLNMMPEIFTFFTYHRHTRRTISFVAGRRISSAPSVRGGGQRGGGRDIFISSAEIDIECARLRSRILTMSTG